MIERRSGAPHLLDNLAIQWSWGMRALVILVCNSLLHEVGWLEVFGLFRQHRVVRVMGLSIWTRQGLGA